MNWPKYFENRLTKSCSKPVKPLVCSPLYGIFIEVATDSEWKNKNHLPTYTKLNKADPSTDLAWQDFKISKHRAKNNPTQTAIKKKKIVVLISTWFILKSVTERQAINVVLVDLGVEPAPLQTASVYVAKCSTESTISAHRGDFVMVCLSCRIQPNCWSHFNTF